MLSFTDQFGRRGRREFLRLGSLALGGLGLPALLAARAQAGPTLVKDRSVIFVFLHGGPGQTETFDPHPHAPAEVRSATGHLPTTLPGVRFGGTFPQLAQRAHRLCIVRSFRTGDGNHDIKPVVCAETGQANLGSLYARVAGSNALDSGIPNNVMLYPRAVDESTQPANMNFGAFEATGSLGAAVAPFVPGGNGSLQESMRLTLPRQRLDDRRWLLAQLDQLRRRGDSGDALAGMDHFQQQAFQTILGGVADAFDLRQESPAVVRRFDTAPLVRPDQISRRWNNYRHYVDNAKSLGKLLLLARRLCEAGCGFVTLTTNFVWDMHADQNNAGMEEGMQYMGWPLDHALSALLDDLQERGLSDRVLVVVCGEMGRTPKLNARGGRDHWGGLAPLLLAGGEVPCGSVHGQSTKDGSHPATTPVEIENLVATVLHNLLDTPQLRAETGLPPELTRALQAAPL